MRILLRVALSLILLLAVIGIAGGIAYVSGSHLPINHTISITGTVQAPPDTVFARITDVPAFPTWRPAVKSVQILPSENGRAHWIEDLGHGQTMTFLATTTTAPTYREVLLDVPGAAYGGTWTYDLQPGTTPNTTTLKITEAGFINPPIYRFMMAHILGPTRNLDIYMKNLQTATKP